jgi:hypothetical protein
MAANLNVWGVIFRGEYFFILFAVDADSSFSNKLHWCGATEGQVS